MSLRLARARARLAAREKVLAAAQTVAAQTAAAARKAAAAAASAAAAVAQTRRTVARLTKLNPDLKGPWMPGIVHDPVTSIGPSTVGEWGGCLHTTEELSFANSDRDLKAKKAEPHFLVGTTGTIKQYRPLTDAGTALEHPTGTPETNRKRLPQIEVCAFANNPDWPTAQKQAVARVMAYCAANGVPLKSTVTFTDSKHVKRLTPQGFLAYRGWLGHQHVPNQPSGHWDPGAIDVGALLTLARKL